MPRAGWARINPWVEDDFEAAEAEYRRAQDAEPPVHGTVQFRVGRHWYLFDQARPFVRAALELNLPKHRRSQAAVWLEVALRADTLDDYALFQAQDKALWILEQLRPLN